MVNQNCCGGLIVSTGGTGGSPGPAGAQGISGPPGFDGSDGVDGFSGNMGPVGFTGPMGPAGSMGMPGFDGVDGVDGTPGSTGATGPAGAAGGSTLFDANSIFTTIPAVSTGTILAAPPAGFVYIIDELSVINNGGVTLTVVLTDADGRIQSSTTGAGLLTNLTATGVISGVYGYPLVVLPGKPLSATLTGAAASGSFFGTYYKVPITLLTAQIAVLTNAFQTLAATLLPTAGNASVPYHLTTVPSVNFPHSSYINNADTGTTHTVQFRVTRGVDVFTFNRLNVVVNSKNPLLAFPALLTGDVVEARTLVAPAVGNVVLRMYHETRVAA